MRFKNAVHAHDGTEEEKVLKNTTLARPQCPILPVSPAKPNGDRRGH